MRMEVKVWRPSTHPEEKNFFNIFNFILLIHFIFAHSHNVEIFQGAVSVVKGSGGRAPTINTTILEKVYFIILDYFHWYLKTIFFLVLTLAR